MCVLLMTLVHINSQSTQLDYQTVSGAVGGTTPSAGWLTWSSPENNLYTGSSKSGHLSTYKVTGSNWAAIGAIYNSPECANGYNFISLLIPG